MSSDIRGLWWIGVYSVVGATLMMAGISAATSLWAGIAAGLLCEVIYLHRERVTLRRTPSGREHGESQVGR